MNASQLKTQVELHNPESFFFTKDTMKFFGDTMSNYGVRAKQVVVETITGEQHTCFELYRKRPVNGGLKSSSYFDVETFQRVLGEPMENAA